jgi:hypothetical protein
MSSVVTLLDNFRLSDLEVRGGTYVPSVNYSVVPLRLKSGPVLIQLNGGGTIFPISPFGLSDLELDGSHRIPLVFQINSMSDHGHLDRLHTELSELMRREWKTYFPDRTTPPRTDDVMLSHQAFVSPRLMKIGEAGSWPGLSKATIEPGYCKVRHQETGCSVSYEMLPGMYWHRAVIELRYLYIRELQAFGIVKRLRYMSVSHQDSPRDNSNFGLPGTTRNHQEPPVL